MKKKLLVAGLIFILTGSLISCDSVTETQKQELVNAVQKYNSMLRRTYLEANLNLMRDVATRDQLNKLFPVIQSLQVTENSMIALQETFTVRKVSFEGETALVRTEETWVYWWQHRETAEITKPRKKITYTIEYNLIKENGFWKVDKLETAE